MMRIYTDASGEVLKRSIEIPVATDLLTVLRKYIQIQLRNPTRWESAIEWIEDAKPGRAVSPQLRKSNASQQEWWD
jgi:hypothetical protein